MMCLEELAQLHKGISTAMCSSKCLMSSYDLLLHSILMDMYIPDWCPRGLFSQAGFLQWSVDGDHVVISRVTPEFVSEDQILLRKRRKSCPLFRERGVLGVGDLAGLRLSTPTRVPAARLTGPGPQT